MKKALFLALSLLFTIGMMQPASAGNGFTVINDTPNNVRIEIVYYTHLCSDDHYVLAPKTRHVSNTGFCRIKSFSAKMSENGKEYQCAPNGAPSNAAVLRVHTNVKPCGVAHA